MRDVELQVASYMDAVIERVDADDIAARMAFRRPVPRWPAHLRWSLAGATAVFATVGAVAVFEWLARRERAPFGSVPSGVADSAFELPGWVLAVGGIAVGGITGSGLVLMAAVIGRRIAHRRENQMETLERMPGERLRPPESAVRRTLYAAAIIVLVLAVGFGTWLLIDEFTGVDREIEVLLEDYMAAWDAGDGEAVVAMMAPGALHFDAAYPDGVGGQLLVGLVDTVHTIMGYHFQTTGDPLIIESSNGYLAAQPGWSGIESIQHPGFNYFELGRRDGELVILRHQWLSGD